MCSRHDRHGANKTTFAKMFRWTPASCQANDLVLLRIDTRLILDFAHHKAVVSTSQNHFHRTTASVLSRSPQASSSTPGIDVTRSRYRRDHDPRSLPSTAVGAGNVTARRSLDAGRTLWVNFMQTAQLLESRPGGSAHFAAVQVSDQRECPARSHAASC